MTDAPSHPPQFPDGAGADDREPAARAGHAPGGADLEVAGLWFWYREESPVLRGVDLSVPRGEFVALVGANGSGKTTLVKHFNGLLRPRSGQVRVAGEDTAHRSVGELARQVGYLFQHPEQQIFSSTVRQELAFGPRNLGLSPSDVENRVETALARFDLATIADQPPAILSYGLRRRVTLASLMAMDPPVLVLDEPAVGLDAHDRRETFEWLAELHARGRTILLVTHDMALAARYADRIVVLRQGQVIADGPPGELFWQTELLAHASLAPPPVLALAQSLQAQGLQGDSLTVEAFCADYVALAEDRAIDHRRSPDRGADGLGRETLPNREISPNGEAEIDRRRSPDRGAGELGRETSPNGEGSPDGEGSPGEETSPRSMGGCP